MWERERESNTVTHKSNILFVYMFSGREREREGAHWVAEREREREMRTNKIRIISKIVGNSKKERQIYCSASEKK